MSLLERLEADYETAFRARDMNRVNVLRLLKSSLKNEAIKVGGLATVLSDAQVVTVLNREVKQRHDSISQYQAGNRPELAEKEAQELKIIETYLPKAMTDQELESVISTILAETGATQKSDMGKVMGALKQHVTNPADISRAAALISQKLL